MSSLKINTRTTVVILITLALALASSVPVSARATGTIWRGEDFNNLGFSGTPSLAREDAASDFNIGYFDHPDEAMARLTWTQTTPVEQIPSSTSTTTTTVITGTVVDTLDPRPLNIRSGPGLEFLPFTTVALGQSVELIGRDVTGAWVQVRFADGRIGWASGRFLVSNFSLANLPVTAPVVSTPPVTTTPGVGGLATGTVITTNRLNVRSGPGLNFSVFATLTQSQAVTLEGRNADGSWLQVRLPDSRLGWVSSPFMAANQGIANLPVTAPTAAPVANTPPTTTTPGIGGLATGTVITANRLNVRSGPDLSFGVFASLILSQAVTLEGRNADGSWLQVRLPDGRLGWVSSSFMAANLDIATLPVTG